MSISKERINQELEIHMRAISGFLGPAYRLTLICRYDGDEFCDADIIKTDDDFDKATAVVQGLRNRAPVGAN